MLLTQGYKLLLNDFQHTVHTVEAYSNLDLTRVQYNIYKLSSIGEE